MTRFTFQVRFSTSVCFGLVWLGCLASEIDGHPSSNHRNNPAVGRATAIVPPSSRASASGVLPVSISPAAPGHTDKGSYIPSLRPSGYVPTVLSSYPANGATDVEVNLANIGSDELSLPPGGVDNRTLTIHTVRLFQVNADKTEVAIAGTVNGSAAGDAIRFTPSFALNYRTNYRFEITAGVKAADGAAFAPYHAMFTTRADSGSTATPTNVAFVKVPMEGTQNERYTSLTIGPDGKLYGLQITGLIKRFPIKADGTLGTPESINTLRDAYKSATNVNGDRSAIGLAFDPSSTASNLIAWVSHCSTGLTTAPEFDGNLSKLSGSALGTHQLVLTRLPRSKKDHMVNGIAFGPDGALYFNQGSNSAAGLSDNYWQREESLLSGAVLRLDLKKLAGLPLPLNVETSPNLSVINQAPSDRITMSDGKYNPYATTSPLTIYASGIRNAYDLVWHSNGQLYVPANGTGPGGNSPASVAGTRRPGLKPTFYHGPAIPATDSVPTQNDWLFRVDPRLPVPGYFGHPNPLRGQYVLNRGPVDNPGYPATVVPDADYRSAAYNFLPNKSPNGVIEYKGNAFGGALKGKLLVCRFSGGGDIIILPPNPVTFDINPETVLSGSGDGIPSLAGFTNPLDIVEHVPTGNLYVAEFDWNTRGTKSQITLLRVAPPATPVSRLSTSPDQVVDNAVTGTSSANHAVTIGNTGTSDLVITSLALVGTDASQFRTNALPALPFRVHPGGALRFNVTFSPASAGLKEARLRVSTSTTPNQEITLNGLATAGLGGSNEPSLQAILDAYHIPVKVGDDDPKTSVIHRNLLSQQASPLGEEVNVQQFQQSEAKDVIIEPLAIFAPATANSVTGFGWYEAGNANGRHELFVVPKAPVSNGQTMNVAYAGVLSFDALGKPFGLFSHWPSSDHYAYGEDPLNPLAGTVLHSVRTYPLKDKNGIVPNAYIVAMEGQNTDLDYQDVVVIVRNVKPAPSAALAALRINTGSLSQAVFEGKTFMADAYVTGNSLAYHNERINDIVGTTNDALYKTERTAATDRGAFTYSIPVSSSSQWYAVRLHFAEIFFGAPGGASGGAGKRVFSVTGEGNPLLTNYDIYREVGSMKAVVKTFNVRVTDGFLTLNFTGSTNRPKISAIEVLPSSDNHAPVVANPIPAQTATEAAPYQFSVAANTFTDPEGNPLTFSASLANNAPLPAWLTFQGASRTFAGTPPHGTASLSIRITASDGQWQASTTFLLTIQPAVAAALYRINAGGPALTVGGKDWSADQYFDIGTPNSNLQGGNVSNTTDDALYYSERYRVAFHYNIPVPAPGTYTVRLHFAETYFIGDLGGVGKRVFNVSVEGKPVLANLDITAEAGPGPAALVKTFTVPVSDGKLTIGFTSVVNNATISAIEILAGSEPSVRSAATEFPSFAPTYVAYPNPISQGQFSVRLSEAYQGELSYTLVSQSGVELKRGKVKFNEPTSVLSFDFSGQMRVPGLYYLRLESQQGRGLLKLVHR